MHFNEEGHIDLIVKFLAQEASAQEKEMLKNWVKESPNNQATFNEMKKLWLGVNAHTQFKNVDIDAAWGKTLNSIQSQTANTTEKGKVVELNREKKKPSWKGALRIAASIFIFLLPAYFFYMNFKNGNDIIIAEKTVINKQLEDGSQVTLNKASTLTYSKSKFNKANRTVTLEGECHFEVEKDLEKPFIIETGIYTVEVVGTSFYVNNRSQDSLLVMVETGKVIVYKKNNRDNFTTLTPGEKGVFWASNKTKQKTSEKDQNEMAWKTKKLSFKNKRLEHIVKKLNKLYEANIEITNPNIEKCRLTVTFDKQPLNEVLKVMEATLNIKIEKLGEKILISGDSC